MTIAEQIKWDFKTNGNLEIRDKNDNRIYFENSGGYWSKREYDSKGNRVYFENSNGIIIDKRPKPSPELTLESLAGQVLKLTEIVTKLVNKS